MDMDQDSAILWTWIKIRANSFIKTLVNNVKRKLTKVPWTLSLTKKNATPHFKEHCTKIDISVAVIHFFFSQTNVVFNITHYLLTYWMVLATVYLYFYLLIFTFILRILKFIQCPYAFNKNQQSFDKVQCSFYKVFILKMLLSHVLFSMKKSYLLTWNCC